MRKKPCALTEYSEPVKRGFIKEALEDCRGNISHAAKLLDMHPSNFRRILRKMKYPGYPKKKSH